MAKLSQIRAPPSSRATPKAAHAGDSAGFPASAIVVADAPISPSSAQSGPSSSIGSGTKAITGCSVGRISHPSISPPGLVPSAIGTSETSRSIPAAPPSSQARSRRSGRVPSPRQTAIRLSAIAPAATISAQRRVLSSPRSARMSANGTSTKSAIAPHRTTATGRSQGLVSAHANRIETPARAPMLIFTAASATQSRPSAAIAAGTRAGISRTTTATNANSRKPIVAPGCSGSSASTERTKKAISVPNPAITTLRVSRSSATPASPVEASHRNRLTQRAPSLSKATPSSFIAPPTSV